ncbi:LysR family transcriptional regulator [Dactylosporangium roseum]|uniref:LysR family transcriptional regulator n=1 Tax=Dactylosporangium roseum TaxID=47989 RepID=A0ABY5ZDW5_9ACTN|nr:LysR family transcriptional regulator [Dactylosporangium roseum]UWZ38504.1 LysR family transcriptional regulator [Dactylosporangium roseum]
MVDGPPLRDIGCFALVARRLSFSRAAAELGMSQPAVSQAVARLERTLGLRLFIRTSREVALTDAGRGLLPHAEAVLDQAAAFAAEAARLAVPAAPGIRLAYAPLVGGFAARMARRLAVRKPPVDVELRPAGWQAATHELTHGLSSAALMSIPFPPGHASAARFHVPVTHLAVATADRLATAARVWLAQAGPLLVPRGLQPSPVAGRRPATRQADAVQRRSDALDAGVRLAPEAVDDPLAAVDLVAAGRGALPVPQLVVETVRRPDVRFVPLADPGLRLTFGLVWRPDRPTEDLMALVQAAQDGLRR